MYVDSLVGVQEGWGREIRVHPSPKRNGERRSIVTYRSLPDIINPGRAALVVACKQFLCQSKVEIGLGIGDQIGVSTDDCRGLIV